MFTAALLVASSFFGGFIYSRYAKRHGNFLWKILVYVGSVVTTAFFSLVLGMVLLKFIIGTSGIPPVELVGRSFLVGLVGPMIGTLLLKFAIPKRRITQKQEPF